VGLDGAVQVGVGAQVDGRAARRLVGDDLQAAVDRLADRIGEGRGSESEGDSQDSEREGLAVHVDSLQGFVVGVEQHG
jgi:hypothetical protein